MGDKQQDALRRTSITGLNPNDPRVIERDIFLIFEKLKTEEDLSKIQGLRNDLEELQGKLEDANIDKAFNELEKDDPTKSRLLKAGKEKVKKYMKEIFKNLISPTKLLEDISLVGLSEEDKMVLIGEVSTSMRKYIIEMGYVIFLLLFPKAGPFKRAAELMMKFRDDTEQKISNARLRRDVDKLLKNDESIMKSLAISDAVSARRYNASKELSTSGQVETTSQAPESQPAQMAPEMNLPAQKTPELPPETSTTSAPETVVAPEPAVASTPTPAPEPSPSPATAGGGGHKKRRRNKTKRRTKGKKNNNKTKRRTKGKRKKTKRRRN